MGAQALRKSLGALIDLKLVAYQKTEYAFQIQISIHSLQILN